MGTSENLEFFCKLKKLQEARKESGNEESKCNKTKEEKSKEEKKGQL